MKNSKLKTAVSKLKMRIFRLEMKFSDGIQEPSERNAESLGENLYTRLAHFVPATSLPIAHLTKTLTSQPLAFQTKTSIFAREEKESALASLFLGH